MSYSKTAWVDNAAPAINAENLNNIESGIFNAHTGIAAHDVRITKNEADIAGLVSGEFPQGAFTPSAGTPYPSPETEGYSWYVSGLTSAGFTYSSGDLNGLTVYNGDKLLRLTASWSLIDLSATVNPPHISKATADALSSMNREKFGGSGFIEWGRQLESGGGVAVNDGIWTASTLVNFFALGRDGTDTGVSKTKYPLVNINGDELFLKLTNNSSSYNKILLPPAPTVTHADSSNSGMILNGKFDTDTSNWTAVNATLSVSNGRLNITNTAAYGYAYQVLSTEVGRKYTIELEEYVVTGTEFYLYVGTGSGAGDLVQPTYTADGRVEVSFTPTTTTTYINIKTGANIGDAVEADNVAVFPADEISRKDLVFLESWHELVSEKDFVYDFGNTQYLGAGELKTAVAGAFTGADTYSLFGNWQSASALVGKGYVWSTLTSAEQADFVSRSENNMYLNDEGEWVQVRYIMRVVQGLGDEWDNVDTTDFSIGYMSYTSGTFFPKPKGKLVSITNDMDDSNVDATGYYRTSDGVKSDITDIGIFSAINVGNTGLDTTVAYEGKCYALPVALVHRRNQGAYHPTFNANGTKRFAVADSSGNTQGGAAWYSIHSATYYQYTQIPTNIADCFGTELTSTGSPQDPNVCYVWGTSGDISSGVTGRPTATSYFYDQIHESDITDLRMDANEAKDLQRYMEKKFNYLVDGTYRGIEGEWEVVSVENFTADSVATSAGWGGTSTYILDSGAVIGVTEGLNTPNIPDDTIILIEGNSKYYMGVYKYSGTNSSAWLHPDYGDVTADFTATNTYKVIVAKRSTRTKSNTLLHCDIIGDPSNWYRGQDYTNTGASQTVDLAIGDVVWLTDATPVGTGVTGHFYKTVTDLASQDISLLDYGNATNFTDLGADWDGAGSWRKDGIAGTPLLVGENGEDYIPDGTSKAYKASKKISVQKFFLWSVDNCVTWTYSSASVDTTTNTYTAGLPAGSVYLWFYTTHTSMAEPTANAEVLSTSRNVTALTDKVSSALVQSMIGKVPVGSQLQEAYYTIDDTHTDLTITESSPAVKVEYGIVRQNGKQYLQLTGKEIKWNTGVIGDNSILSAVDNVTTATDNNGDVILVFNKIAPLDKFIGDAE